jgi:hypothetical protein
MHQDVLPQMDDRAIGMIGNSLHYAAGLDTPEGADDLAVVDTGPNDRADQHLGVSGTKVM